MIEYRSGGRRVGKNQFFENLERDAIKLAMKELEQRVRGTAASVIDPETGKHAEIFVRQRDESSLLLSTKGSPAFAREVERRLGMTTGTIESKGTKPIGDVPRLYLAHASEDHDTLAKPLATRLMANRIEVWFDEWEIRTGDSLRRKMEEGLQNCTHFMALLSPIALTKPWVQTEIDVGFIRAIGGESRFLGIRLGTQIKDLSPFLQSLRCPEIDLTNAAAVDALIADIHGLSRKPELGPAPKYVKTAPEALAAWSKSALAVAEYLVRNSKFGRKFDPQMTVSGMAKALDLPEEDVRLGALDLADSGLIERSKESGPQRFWPTTSLFVEFDRHFLNFDNEKDAVALANWLVNQDINLIKIGDLAPSFPDWEPRRMNSALNYLDDANLVETSKNMSSGPWGIFRLRVTDRTRRFVRDHG